MYQDFLKTQFNTDTKAEFYAETVSRKQFNQIMIFLSAEWVLEIQCFTSQLYLSFLFICFTFLPEHSF